MSSIFKLYFDSYMYDRYWKRCLLGIFTRNFPCAEKLGDGTSSYFRCQSCVAIVSTLCIRAQVSTRAGKKCQRLLASIAFEF